MNCNYSIREQTTKDTGKKTWLVQPVDTMTTKEWSRLRRFVLKNGGKYLRSKLSFSFSEDPRKVMQSYIDRYCSSGEIIPIEVEHQHEVRYKTNPNGPTGVQEKIEERLRKAQEKKKFRDTRGRIGGSKKEKIAYNLISMQNLSDIEQDPIIARKMVEKDKVWQPINLDELN